MADDEIPMLLLEEAEIAAAVESAKSIPLKARYPRQFRVFKLRQQIENQIGQRMPVSKFKEVVKTEYKRLFPESAEPDDGGSRCILRVIELDRNSSCHFAA